MKKTLAVLAALVLLAGLLCACGDKAEEAPAELDMAALDTALEEGGVFSDILNPPFEVDVVTMLYGLDEADITTCLVRCSTGATAEELAVFEAPDAAAAGRIAGAMETRVAAQTESFRNYVPEEVLKLEKAIIRTSGNYVVYITAADPDEAGKILDAYL